MRKHWVRILLCHNLLFCIHSLVPSDQYEKWLTSLVNVFQYEWIMSFAYSSIWNNTSSISAYVQTLRVTLVYVPKYHYSAITNPHNILFTCNRNSRSFVTLTVGIEFLSPWVCFTFRRTNLRSFWSTFLSGAVWF